MPEVNYVTKDAFDIQVSSLRERAASEEKLTDIRFEHMAKMMDERFERMQSAMETSLAKH